MKSLGKSTVITVIVTAAITSVAMGGVLATATPDQGDQLTACVNKTNGNMRLVDSGDQCRESEYPVSWNQMGAPGPEGPTGPSGLSQAFFTISSGGSFEAGDPPVDHLVIDVPAGNYIVAYRTSTWIQSEDPDDEFEPGGVTCTLFSEADGSRVQLFPGNTNLVDEPNRSVNDMVVGPYGADGVVAEDTRFVWVCEHAFGPTVEHFAGVTFFSVDTVNIQETPWPD